MNQYSPELLNVLFSYHHDTDGALAPRYRRILKMETDIVAGLSYILDTERWRQADAHQQVNSLMLSAALVVDFNCPDGEDKDEAIKCLRVVRMCVNECIALMLRGSPPPPFSEIGVNKLLEARWWACSAIANSAPLAALTT